MSEPRWVIDEHGEPVCEFPGTGNVVYVSELYHPATPYNLAVKALSLLRSAITAKCDVALLRRVLSEYLAGNRIVNGHWYSPDENGEPHNINQPATPDELALIETLRTEAGQ